MQDNFLVSIKKDQDKYNPVPTILIDVSCSTQDSFNDGTVIKYEFDLAKQIINKTKNKEANIICWSSIGKLFKNQSVQELNDILEKKKYTSNCTYLVSGLDLIEDDMLDDKRINEIIIITDGEIYDNSICISHHLQKLNKHKIEIKIIAVESNKIDYLKNNCYVGNTLFKIIQDNCLTRLVNKFSIYNELETEFINLYNPTIEQGYIPFQDKMFAANNLSKFINYIDTKLSLDLEKAKIIKLVHELSLSVYYLIKDKNYQQQTIMIDVFTNMFNKYKNDNNIYSQVRSVLLNEISNHLVGKSTTFTESIRSKQLDIENTQLSLIKNVQESINSSYFENLYKYSFLVKYNDKKMMIVSADNTVDITLDKIKYIDAGIQINNYVFPTLFKFRNNESALQWLKIHYSRVLNISQSNEYIYYYFLADAYIILELNKENIDEDIKELYESYVKLVMNDKKYGSEISIIDSIISSWNGHISDHVMNSCLIYSQLDTDSMTLYNTLMNYFIVPYFKDKDSKNKENFVKHLEEKYPLGKLINKKDKDTLILIEHNTKETYVTKEHKISETNITCPKRIAEKEEIDNNICVICNSPIATDKIDTKIDVNIIDNKLFNGIKHQFCYNTLNHIDLGELTGIDLQNNKLICPEDFQSDVDYIKLSNTMIIDPISSSKLKIKTNEEFVVECERKYPFLKGLDMSNVALCGGFVRSILLKQKVKDFDFFFYDSINEYSYVSRFKKLLQDTISKVKEFDNNLKFGMFYKPLYNVFELICYEDPTNHINNDFTLDNFDIYDFMSLQHYLNRNNPNYDDYQTKNDSNYFEDNDDKGIKMRYRFQYILCKYRSIEKILESFDMFPSKVAYDGKQVYFTEKSLRAYKYMINEINLDGGSELFKHRLNKYFKYGFSIVFPSNDRKWDQVDYDNNYEFEQSHYDGENENIGPLKFAVRKVDNNVIYINHGSNMEQILDKNLDLEQKSINQGKALYKSSLFCSFVSILRYAKINSIDYLFSQDDDIPFVDNQFISKNGKIEIEFLERYSKYKDRKWFDTFYKSIQLTDYVEEKNKNNYIKSFIDSI